MKENCGNAVYKAGRANSNQIKHQDETGLIMCSCRHGVVFRAIDMHEGENYRLVLFMLNDSYQLGYKIFCYDVIWFKLHTVFEEFGSKATPV